ncbi:zincin [Hortaea werneckii]|nr:zincin [Hortaea werneckii]KAI6880908.1 zincin [Hortaea werneckii]KAI6989151.1 zincin [Hortaea werneckii]KAI7142743.1 zincin [Hortaea werneckii]KAI7169679.1 zincin [Hortaea werneckii]
MRCLPLQLLSLAVAVVNPIVEASSNIRNPISALSTIQNATIHTNNHRVTALSEFDLTFNLRDDLYVKFRLEPNHDILAKDANVAYLAPDGSVSHRENVDRYQHKVFKGQALVKKPNIGQTKYQPVGWARVTVTRDGKTPQFQGAFSVSRDHHHIQSSNNYMRTRHRLDPEIERLDENDQEYMVLWRDSDILPSAQQLKHQELRRRVEDEEVPSCQADGLNFNLQSDHPVYLGMRKRDTASFGVMDFKNLFGKRQVDGTTGGNSAGVNLVANIGDSSGCPSTRKVALVGVATDCTYTGDFNSTESVRENVIDQVNTASALYESTFNISLGLANLTVSDASCPGTPAQATEWNQDCSDSVDIQDRLNMFSVWRGLQQDNNALWTLLSTCNTGSAVGLAWLGQACVQDSITTNQSTTGNGASTGSGQETVTGANVVIRTQGANEWQVMAHEIGHTFGAVHDCTSQTCAQQNTVSAQQCCPLSANTCDAGEQYIMNPSTSQGITDFSPCSIGNICSAIGRGSVSTECLTNNQQVDTISGQQCGNGIVEPGEDCDCGGEEGCGDNECCDASSCTYKSGAVCDDSNEDCCRNCQLASNGTVCRESTGDCDPEEVCPGDSATCPEDSTSPNGESCGNGVYCANGQCTSRDEQCKSVMGSYTQGNDTYACDSQGCTISCASPEFGPGVCYGLQQNFLDGTECGGGGRCMNGQCKGSTVGGQVKSWIDDHKGIVIGVCCAVGGLILLSICGCCLRSCRRRRHMSKVPPPPPPGGWQGWNQGRRGPAMMQRGNQFVPYQPPPQHASHGWFGGGGGWNAPPVPPPAYAPRGGGGVRYA